jgi:hypothetical protein
MLWCELGIHILIYPLGSPTLARAAQTADGDLKYEPPVLHLALFPGSGAIPWGHNYLLKLQRLQNRVLRNMGNYPRRTPTRDLHMAFKIPYVYDFITKLCRQQAEVIQNHDNENVRNIGQGEAQHRKYTTA